MKDWYSSVYKAFIISAIISFVIGFFSEGNVSLGAYITGYSVLILGIMMILILLFNKPIKTNKQSTLNNTGNQAVSLRSFPLFRSAVPVGRAFLRSTDTSQHKKIRQSSQRRDNLIFSAVRSSSSHGLFLRSVGLMHPQYRFISLQSFVRLTLHFIPLKALSLVSLHSSRIMSAALSFFSGCSFAQPSGLAPLPFSCVFHF